MPVDVSIIAPGNVEPVLERDQAGHRVRAGAIHADLAIVIERHEAKGRINLWIDDLDIQSVKLGNRLPVSNGGTTQGIDSDPQIRLADCFHVDDFAEVGNIRRHQINCLGGRRIQGLCIRQPLDAAIAVGHQRIGALLDPAGNVGICRATVRRVVLDAAILRGIVRRRDDDAVRPSGFVGGVECENGARNDRRRRVAIIGLQMRQYVVGSEHFQRRLLRRIRKSMGVLAEKQRAVDPGLRPVFRNRLSDCQYVRLVEAAVQGAAAMAAGAKGNALGWVVDVRYIPVSRQQSGNISQAGNRGHLAGKRMSHVLFLELF